jgi:hypothetical protein
MRAPKLDVTILISLFSNTLNSSLINESDIAVFLIFEDVSLVSLTIAFFLGVDASIFALVFTMGSLGAKKY